MSEPSPLYRPINPLDSPYPVDVFVPAPPPVGKTARVLDHARIKELLALIRDEVKVPMDYDDVEFIYEYLDELEELLRDA